MRRGKRLLAGLAASALGVGMLAFVAAPQAQAADTVAVYCAGNGTGVNGSAGTLPDPTTVQPNCSISANVGVNGKSAIGESAFIGSTTTWVRMTIDGDSTWDDTNAAWTPSAISPTVTNSGKTITVLADDMGATTTIGASTKAIINVPTAGIRTITVETSSAATAAIPPNNQFAAAGEFTVTGLGGNAQAIVSQGYYAVSQLEPASAGAVDDTAAVAIVHVVDAAGNVINVSGASVSNLTFNTSAGTIRTQPYRSQDCTANGLLADFDPGNTAASEIVTDACATVLGAGVRTQANSGLWVTWDGPAATNGSFTATFTLNMPNGDSYPISVGYVVSSPTAASMNLVLNKTQFQPGEAGVATASLTDLNGNAVPDGLGWTAPGTPTVYARSVRTVSNNVDSVQAWSFNTDDSFATYNGENYLAIQMPPQAMANFQITVTPSVLGTTLSVQNGWLGPIRGQASVVSAQIGNPEPPAPGTIMISGIRGAGNENRTVFVEGNTINLVGATVTPFYRFPGQVGFTAGTGVRTVDAEGNFAWQRKTGKRIAVQFRTADGLQSNSIIIEANTR